MPILTLKSRGRGDRYSWMRGLMESASRVLFVGDWPAAAWAVLGRASRVEVARRTLAVRPAGRPPLRAGFISDLHLGPTTSPATLDRAFAALAEASLDLLLLGGDYVYLDATPRRAAELTRRVAAVPAGRKLAVFGNHDLWTDHGLVEEALAAAGVEVLINRSSALPPPHDDVAVVGFDDTWTGKPDAEAAFAAGCSAEARIVLCHSPDGLIHCEGREFALFLCGHTHGGQIAAPWGPLVTAHGRLTRAYSSGFFNIGESMMFVSRGVGGIEVPVRFMAPPDVAVLDLVAREPHAACVSGLASRKRRPCGAPRPFRGVTGAWPQGSRPARGKRRRAPCRVSASAPDVATLCDARTGASDSSRCPPARGRTAPAESMPDGLPRSPAHSADPRDRRAERFRRSPRGTVQAPAAEGRVSAAGSRARRLCRPRAGLLHNRIAKAGRKQHRTSQSAAMSFALGLPA